MIPNRRHIFSKASDKAKTKMRTYPQSDHALPHYKCTLRCCSECPHINIPEQETNKNMKKQHPRLGFTFIMLLDLVLFMVEFH